MGEGLAAYFEADHRACDERWAHVEAAVADGDAGRVREAWARFERGMRRHLAREEDVLFPAFEAATGMTDAGPTHVMRSEHARMRGVLEQMALAAERGEYDALLDQGDTLLMLVQQHNAKEEAMLYPMAEATLADRWPELRQRLAQAETGATE